MAEKHPFPLISGNISVDLVNTEVVRRGQRHDLLVTENDLSSWLHVMYEDHILFYGQLDSILKEQMDIVLAAVKELRAFLRAQFEKIADDQMIDQQFIAYLEGKIKKAPFSFRLLNEQLVPKPIGEIAAQLISLIAYDALTLIAEKKLVAIKRCSNEDCVLLFIDESGRRKWCSMKICGNRKKVARFQQKQLDIE